MNPNFKNTQLLIIILLILVATILFVKVTGRPLI